MQGLCSNNMTLEKFYINFELDHIVKNAKTYTHCDPVLMIDVFIKWKPTCCRSNENELNCESFRYDAFAAPIRLNLKSV